MGHHDEGSFSAFLANAKHVGELQAVSFWVAFQGDDILLSYLPEFITKTESERNPLPRSFLARSLSQSVGNLLDESLLCPVRAVRTCLALTSSIPPRSRSLFISPRSPSRALSKNTLSFFLLRVIIDADAVWEGATPRAHSIRGMAMSAAFLRN